MSMVTIARGLAILRRPGTVLFVSGALLGIVGAALDTPRTNAGLEL